jgi:hypothetical protein
MIELLLTAVIQTTNPCDEIYDELMLATESKIVTLREAEEIYRRCLVSEL